MPRSHSGYCTGLLIRALRGSQVQFLPEAFLCAWHITSLARIEFEENSNEISAKQVVDSRELLTSSITNVSTARSSSCPEAFNRLEKFVNSGKNSNQCKIQEQFFSRR